MRLMHCVETYNVWVFFDKRKAPLFGGRKIPPFRESDSFLSLCRYVTIKIRIS